MIKCPTLVLFPSSISSNLILLPHNVKGHLDHGKYLLRRASSGAFGRRRLPSSLLYFPLCFPVTPLRCCFVSGSGQASLVDSGDRSRGSSEFAIDSACVGVKTRWCAVDLAVESDFSWLRERIVFSSFNLSLATFLLGMIGLERSPVGCGVATAFLWLWRAASSFGTGNPYGVVGVRLLFVGAKVSSGGGFTSEVRRGLVCRQDDVSNSMVVLLSSIHITVDTGGYFASHSHCFFDSRRWQETSRLSSWSWRCPSCAQLTSQYRKRSLDSSPVVLLG
ncbi:hypothetical protein DY000_02026404 [Brassica cretica]|uniref:Uncharacterized protein n=1 Tax=Brassica cretica TaxID=69181 RepID=A0ABQ7ED74_BRACR|nr:hypothetical protein DY000_02026404 [Brassica cretica]